MVLVVRPVLVYSSPKRKLATSWRDWGAIQTSEAARYEAQRIADELKKLEAKADFPIKILSLTIIANKKDLKTLFKSEKDKEQLPDVYIIYAAGGKWRILRSLVSRRRSIIFLRHLSGPTYLWYEIVHPTLIRATTDRRFQSWIDYDDVVIDDYNEIFVRLKALYGLKNTLGRKIISIGRAGGWGNPINAILSPIRARTKWKLRIKSVSYRKLKKMINAGFRKYHTTAQEMAEKYLSSKGVSLKTDKNFVINAFILYLVFKEIMRKYQADAITVNECMSTIIPIAKTTACLTLSLLNDEGYMAFCESDFVVIPCGILMRQISGRPVFLNDPTFPHDGIVTIAHCTAPRKMDGTDTADVTIMTHFESDYGAAPKVEFKKGQVVTIVIPDFNFKKYVVFKGKIAGSPNFEICRSQAEILIEGNWRRLVEEMRGFHWLMVYGDYIREIKYALKKLGIKVLLL
ncbi:MAG: sugar isomerase [Candidatus Korarchaeota archaeon]